MIQLDRSCKSDDRCQRCSSTVSNEHKALLCDLCSQWEHFDCAKVHPDWYDAALNHPTERFPFICTPCHAKRQRKLVSTKMNLPRSQSVPSTSSKRAPPTSDTDTEERVKKTSSSGRKRSKRPADGSNIINHVASNTTASNSELTSFTVPNPVHTDVSTSRNSVQTNFSPCNNSVAESESPVKPWTIQARKHRSGIIYTPATKALDPPQSYRKILMKIDELRAVLPCTQCDPSARNTEAKVIPRGNCLVVSRIPESSAESSQKRYAHDLKFIQEMTDKLLDPDEPGVLLKRIIRLGPRSTECFSEETFAVLAERFFIPDGIGY